MTKGKAGDFLKRMSAPPKPEFAPAPRPATAKPVPARGKHFGAYLDDETLEKIAVLRARLRLDNSDLCRAMVEDFWRRHGAKRAFGD